MDKALSAPKGLRISEPVELVDLMPTILSLLSLGVPEHVQGRDLTPLFDGGTIRESAIHVDGSFGRRPPQQHLHQSGLTAVIGSERWSYVNHVHHRQEDGVIVYETRAPGELFLLDEDPDQQINLIDDRPELARRLEDQLVRWYTENEVLARELRQVDGGTPREPLLSDEEREKLRGLGYVE